MDYKGYTIFDGGYSMRAIKPIGSGALPKLLKGFYTDVGAAMQVIDRYIRDKKVKTNGKAIRSSRDK
jgi:hypothetical protein